MIQDFQLRLVPEVAYDMQQIKLHIANTNGLKTKDIKSLRILKRSIDARQRQIYVNLTVKVWINEEPSSEPFYERIQYKPETSARYAIVVGAGPAGLFAALRLIELGIRPIVLERGKNVTERRVDIADISKRGVIDPDSNYCFGEGGAGAYSDGKLYTRSKKRGSVQRILSIFNQHGASDNILIDAHPHIGTDKLPKVIENMRNTILSNGGEVHFQTKVTDIVVDTDGNTKGVITADGTEYAGKVILATGHSARDVYAMLHDKHIPIEAKGIAVGVRLEHPQHIIDRIQYHSPEGRCKYLPAAEYSFVTQVDGRGVYSCCMCPGGCVVPAASSPGQLVVNGMSPSNRGSYWANSGMVVEVRPEDIPLKYGDDELKVMRFQEALEHECFRQAGESQRAGAQRMKDFVNHKDSQLIPPSSYTPGLQPSRLDKWLPQFVAKRLAKGFEVFGRQAKGFLTNDAILIGVETRTSSPVRIPRDEVTMNHITIKGLYPCGEGAGYAGGIVSAAIDGERCAEKLAESFG